MNSHRQTGGPAGFRQICGLLGAGALLTALAACGGSAPSPSASTSTTPPAPASTPAASPSSSAPGSAATQATIAANWEKFFSPKTPTATRESLLQDGSQFASVISAQSGQGLAATASAKVTSVDITSNTQATVHYNILVSGAVALPNQTGVAVLQNGTWKVGVQSFCGLLTLEQYSPMPGPCSSAG